METKVLVPGELSEPWPELLLVEPCHPGQQIIWLPVGVEPAHLHVTKLAALCAQGTLNFTLYMPGVLGP